MPDTKHTPGPWIVDGQNILIDHGAQIGIAKVYGNIGQPKEANAKLIAAAPELLEACKVALRKFDMNEGQISNCIASLEMAIEKATA